jgi:methionyl-tRNA synthetase
MNEAIAREYGNNYADTISSVQASFNTSLVNGGMGAQAAAEFFNQIEQAMALIGEHMNDAELGSFKALQ